MNSMFVISGRYLVPIEEVERVLPAHREFLDKYYAKGIFICSGAMNPREGGVIICNAGSRDEVDEIFKEDPFQTEGVAQYCVTEFVPTKVCTELQRFIVR